MLNKVGALGLALALSLGLAACEDDPIGGDGTSHVRILLTDAPGPLKSAHVEIKEIYLQGSGGQVTLYEGGETFDLLTLQNGVREELAELEIPSGSYSEIRLVVGDATIVTADNRTFSTTDHTLKCPSCSSSGLKVKLPGGQVVLDEDSEILVLDFDVAQSFGHEAGKSGRWILHPVIHATDFVATGSIAGTVSLAQGVTLPSCGGSAMTLEALTLRATQGDLTLTTRPAAGGAFRFSAVAPGSYTLSLAPTADFGNGDQATFAGTATPSTATVGSGQGSSANYTVTSVSCKAAGS